MLRDSLKFKIEATIEVSNEYRHSKKTLEKAMAKKAPGNLISEILPIR